MSRLMSCVFAGVCVMSSSAMAAKVVPITSTDGLMTALKDFHSPKGYIHLHKCTGDSGKTFSGSDASHVAYLKFDQHTVATSSSSLQVHDSFYTMMDMHVMSDISLLPANSDTPQKPLIPAEPVNGTSVGVHGIRSLTFHKGEGHVDVKYQYYDMDNQPLWETELSCPWKDAIRLVYHP